MNILHITNHLDTGGITSYVLTLSRGLKQRGHNIYIASSGGELLTKFEEVGIIYIPIPIKTKKEISPKIIASLCKLSRLIKDNKIDIIHAHSRTTQVLACLLHRLTGATYIFTCHGFFKRRILRRIFPCWPEKVIAISEQVREHLVRDFNLEDNRIAVVHNGIDVDNFRTVDSQQLITNKTKLGLGPGPVIGIIARLSEVKGHRYLIQAMQLVLGQSPQASLLIIGEGKTLKSLTDLASSLGISKSVFFIPQASDTQAALSAMDIFVMPSLQEGLGLALMEAMASGLAVIGSNVGGIKTLIQDGYNGLLVEPADAQGLARAISILLSDRLKRLDLGAHAQDFMRKNFSLSKMVMETEKEYLLCLDAKD